MASYRVITADEFAGKRWKRFRDYQHAKGDAFAPLVAAELPRACLAGPVAFLRGPDRTLPVMLQGVSDAGNLFVDPSGRWLGGYTPAVYRAHPFRLATLEDGRKALCFDTDSELLLDAPDNTEGSEAFFGDDGATSQAIAGVLDFVSRVAEDEARTARITSALEAAALLEPWPEAPSLKAGHRSVPLHRINAKALAALAGEGLAELHQLGALELAYAQLFSVTHLALLQRLAQQREQAPLATLPTDESGDLALDFFNDEELRF